MAAAKPPAFVRRVQDAIKAVATAGIPARVASEPIRGTKLVRFAVLSSKFEPLTHSERQGIVWRIVERALPPNEQLLISGIMTLTPEEAGEVPTTNSTRVAKRI